MVQDYEDILKCLRNKTLDELTGVQLDTPSFLTGMGPSRDGVLIPADFGADYVAANRKRSSGSPYQVSQDALRIVTNAFNKQNMCQFNLKLYSIRILILISPVLLDN